MNREVQAAILRRHKIARRVLEAEADHFEWLTPNEKIVLGCVLRGEPQNQIAERLGCSQPTVSYRAQRALWRLERLQEFPKPSRKDIEFAVAQVFSDFGPSTSLGQLGVQGLCDVLEYFLQTTCQSQVAVRFKVSQGAVRHWLMRLQELWGTLKNPRSDDRVKRVLRGIQFVQEHGLLRGHAADYRSAPAVPGSVPSVEELREWSSHLPDPPLGPLPPPETRAPPIPANEVQMLVEVLNAHGPQTRKSVVEILNAEGVDGDRVIRAALMRGAAFRKNRCLRLGQGDYQNVSFVFLLPPAAMKPKQSFDLDWHAEMKKFCSVYDGFTTREAMRHLGITVRAHSIVYQDNVGIVRSLIKSQGFKETEPDLWKRKSRTRKKAAKPLDSEELCSRVLTTLKSGGLMRRGEIEKAADISAKQCQRAVKQLIQEGRILKFGEGSNTSYTTR